MAQGTEEQTKPIEAPELNIQIPGLKFATDIKVKGGELAKIPFLSQYLAAIYNYLMGAAIVAAAVMVVYGGFLYVIGSTMSSIKRGKEVIKDALVGLFLVLGCYVILQTVNSSFQSEFKTLDLLTVKRENEKAETIPTNNYWQAVNAANNPNSQAQPPTPVPGGGGGAQTQTPGQPADKPPPAPDAPKGSTVASGPCKLELNSLKLPTKESVYKCAITTAKEVGIDPCIMVAVLNHDSFDGLPNSISFDENVPDGISRLDFLSSGTFSYPKDGSGGFEKPNVPPECSRKALADNGMSEDDINTTLAKCDAARNVSIRNNDVKNFEPTKPDLGLTWNKGYGRGIGAMMTMVSKSNWCSGGPSIRIPPGTGACFTPQQLLDTYTALKAGASVFKANDTQGLEGMFQVWNPDPKYDQMLAKDTQDCMQSGEDPMQFMSGPFICRGDIQPFTVTACQEENKQREEFNKTAPKGQKKWLIRKDCQNDCYDPRNPLSSSMIQP